MTGGNYSHSATEEGFLLKLNEQDIRESHDVMKSNLKKNKVEISFRTRFKCINVTRQ